MPTEDDSTLELFAEARLVSIDSRLLLIEHRLIVFDITQGTLSIYM